MNAKTEKLAQVTLEINAIRLNPQEPFTWASGFRMPIYNDNRKLFSQAAYRSLVAELFLETIAAQGFKPDVIAGVATAGIPHATTLADKLEKPLIYVRAKAKDHGLKNMIEGVLHAGQKVLVVEDLISTGQSSLAAVQSVREAGGEVLGCVAIFNYGFEEAQKLFADAKCPLTSLLKFDEVLEVAVRGNYIKSSDFETVKSWRTDPFGWGEKHGFARVIKG